MSSGKRSSRTNRSGKRSRRQLEDISEDAELQQQERSLPDAPTDNEHAMMVNAGDAAVTTRKAIAAARQKPPTPPPKDDPPTPPPKDEPKKGSTASAAPKWPAAFSGTPRSSSARTPRGSSTSRPMPFIGSGQVTYVGETEFKAIMTMIIFWDTDNVWGQFTISGGLGHGYLRSKFVPKWEPIKNGETVKFNWRGCGGSESQKVPFSHGTPPECTKVTIKFSKDGDKIEGEMHPMDRKGRVHWVMGGDKVPKLEDHKFTFSGLRQDESKEDGVAAWNGWAVFGKAS